MESKQRSLIQAQRAFFLSGKTKSIDFRIDNLKNLKRTIIENYDKLIHALKQDISKSEFEIFATEIMNILDELNLAVRNLHSWAKPHHTKTPLAFFKSSSRYCYEPFGCVLVIGAWNYPLSLSFIPLINAIAAGNCCILKPSEISSHSSSMIAHIIKGCFDESLCAVVEGGAEETTALLSEDFDFIHYTGSIEVGKIVAEAAAKKLTPFVLELGGKSPCIVDETANITISAKRICWGKFTNAGQICVAPDYLLVHESIKEKLLEAIKSNIVAFYTDNPQNSMDYPRIVNEKHFDRLLNLTDPKDIVFGGRTERENLYIEPTISEPASFDCKIMQEEIFGPLLPVFTFRDISQAIRLINSKYKNPLALYVFSESRKKQKKILNEIPFGGGCINSVLMHVGNPYLPFGGRGSSGMGNYHGKFGFETFSHRKSILKKSTGIDFPFQYPPFGNRIKLLKKIYLR